MKLSEVGRCWEMLGCNGRGQKMLGEAWRESERVGSWGDFGRDWERWIRMCKLVGLGE